MTNGTNSNEFEEVRDLLKSLQDAMASEDPSPTTLVEGFGGVVRRFFPDSVGALLQDMVKGGNGTLSQFASELGCAEKDAANLLVCCEALTRENIDALARTLAKKHDINMKALARILNRALVRRAMQAGGPRSLAARDQWDEGGEERKR